MCSALGFSDNQISLSSGIQSSIFILGLIRKDATINDKSNGIFIVSYQ